MKKVIAILATSMLFFAGQAAAKDSTGCGLGTKLFEGKSGVMPQVLAVTTNGTSGNQTFGISSGTLGCDSNGTVSMAERLDMFTGDNMEKLALDMSRGEGESLAAMADLMEIAEEDRAAFYALTKDNFDRIVVSTDITAGELLENVRVVMGEDAALARYVS
ncbi:MAG: DUF3015 domain-containing protein [Gammaproteobacteria bacterium]|nr:DUF3015 domain-containing protein [Gammaproteobacteria bacterium]